MNNTDSSLLPIAQGEGHALETREKDQGSPFLTPFQSRSLGLALVSVWGFVLFNIFASWAGDSAVRPSYFQRSLAKMLSPQGWAFFTRNPRESWQHGYFLREDGTLEPANGADHRGAPWRGAIRASRNRGVTMGQVEQSIPKDAWKSCGAPVATCLSQFTGPIPKVHVRMNDNSGFCGRVVFEDKTQVPWAWRASYERVHRPSRVAVVDVVCTPPTAAREALK